MKSPENILEDDLQSLGLTRNEGKVLIAMVKIDIALEASKISNISGVPRSKIYQVLEGLIAKSIIVKGEVQGKANIYRLLFDTKEIIARLQNLLYYPIENAAERSIKNMTEIANTMTESIEGIQEVSLIQGQKHIERIIKLKIDSAEVSILTNITPEFIKPIAEDFRNAKERGVEISVLMLEEETERLSESMNIEDISTTALGINFEKLNQIADNIPEVISPSIKLNLRNIISSFGIFLGKRPILFMIDKETEHPSSFLIIKSDLGETHNTAIQTDNKDFIEAISAILNVIFNIASSIKSIQTQFLTDE
jgi:sugar-specific transcriptional regulator TrmB